MSDDVFKRERDALAEEARKLRVKLREAERYIKVIRRENDDADKIRKVIFDLAALRPNPAPWIAKPRKPAKDVTFSVPVAFWSDWHYGELVSREQLGGINEFNRRIAKTRITRLVDITCDLAQRHMGTIEYPGIVIALGGDMISGNIHEELRETNDGTVQQCVLDLQDQLTSALTYMADRFGRVYVPCVVGNHGRTKMKPHAKNRAFENYESGLYQQLVRHFRGDSRFHFDIPEGPDVNFNVLGHRFMLTHGDALGVKGGDGIIGALGPIARGAVKVGRAQARGGRAFDTLMFGHWHTYIPRGEASPVAVNGTLKGFDEFAHTILRVPYSRPSQSLFFVHADHGITAQWQVYLEGKERAQDSATWVSFQQR